MNIIVLSALLSASNTDILNSTRLQTVPHGGSLTFEFSSNLADATNNYTLSIQMPNGDTPLNDILIPGSNPSLAGVLDERTKLMITLPIQQGGHAVVSVTETGAALLIYRIMYSGPRIPQ